MFCGYPFYSYGPVPLKVVDDKTMYVFNLEYPRPREKGDGEPHNSSRLSYLRLRLKLEIIEEVYQEIIKMLSKEPVDVISVSAYGYTDKGFGTVQNMLKLHGKSLIYH